MNSFKAFAMGIATRDMEPRVFDWDKAARIIRSVSPKYATVGLLEDFEWTNGIIFDDGKPVRSKDCFLRSTWATPILVDDEGNQYECWKMQSEVPRWHEKTLWPKSALRILKGEDDVPEN